MKELITNTILKNIILSEQEKIYKEIVSFLVNEYGISYNNIVDFVITNFSPVARTEDDILMFMLFVKNFDNYVNIDKTNLNEIMNGYIIELEYILKLKNVSFISDDIEYIENCLNINIIDYDIKNDNCINLYISDRRILIISKKTDKILFNNNKNFILI